MIFYYVILLFLSWPQAKCTEDANLNDEEIFDQFATASENVVHAGVKLPNADLKNHREEVSSVSSSIDATVQYENSNGFVPIVPSVSPSYDDPDSSLPLSQTDDPELQNPNQSEVNNATNVVSARDSSDTKAKNFDLEDLAYSSEARIFLNLPGSLTNRRSFDFQEDRPNAFELLKVNNDTPAVANYQDFYEDVHSTVNTDSESDASSSGRPNGERAREIEKHPRNYGRQQRTSDENTYTQYHSYNDAQDTKKTAYEQEKVAGNYHQQNTANYDGHGQSAARQNAAAVSSSSRTNYEVNALPHSGTYDSVAESSKTRHRFSRPVVVAEPSNHNVNMKFSSQLRNNDDKTLRNLKSSGSGISNHQVYDDNNRQRSYHHTEDSENSSDESSEYSEYIERPRIQKNRRRPSYPDHSKKLLKEHRGTSDGSAEEDKYKHSSSKLKSQRHRVKANPWVNDPIANHRDESVEDVRHDTGSTKSSKAQHASMPINTNTWNQISPNLEISHSNGIELDQVEKPKYVVPVKVNLVPLANFDHATALGNSQGFDMSNAVLQNLATVSPIGAFSTTSPLLNTPQPVLAQNLALSKNLVSTPVPVDDIIVGQNTFQSPVHTVLLSQPNGQNKVVDTLRTSYLPSTMTPVFALTSSLTPTLQNVRVQNLPNNVTPRTAFAVTPSPTSIVHHVPINQVHSGMQQLLVPQPTVQTFSSFLQTPLQTAQIQVNPHGLHGQNLISHGNLQVQGLPTTPTLLSNQAVPEGRANLVSEDSNNKKNAYSDSGTSFLASANLVVGQNDQKQANNVNYYLQNHNTQHVDMMPKTKSVVQATQVVPTVLQPGATLSGMTVNTLVSTQQNLQDANLILQRPRDQQYIKLQGNGAEDTMQQLQAQINKQFLKNNRLPNVVLQTADSAASHSNTVNTLGVSSGNAHLPNVGTKNVEIINPNIKPSQIDPTMNTYQTMHYPAAVLTTPIPIFSTIAPVTPQTVGIQNYVDSLTETGTRAKQPGGLDLKTSQNQERPVFNPINFVPNVDIIKNQNTLNNKLPTNEPVQQGLNLVPVMPGGNFFKPSFTAQTELLMKPKLASDLQKYAEEMFKESLKTMYNSQKWNNDRKPQGNSQNYSEGDLAKLRLELQKLRTSLTESKYRDILEAYQSENNVRATDATVSVNGKKKPDPLLSTLEHLLKTRPGGPIHIYHGTVKSGRKPKPGDSNFSSSFHDDLNENRHLKEFLMPPRPKPFHSKGPFHDKPVKKRPGSRFKNGPRKPARSPPRSGGLEASASNIDLHLERPRYHRPPFDSDNIDFDPRHQMSFDSYPSFTTPTPELLGKLLREMKASSNKDYDINHPRMHNLLGLLMKNKQLPTRSTPENYFRDKDQVRQLFEDEKNRAQQQFYDDVVRDYIDRTSIASRSGSVANMKVYPRNGSA